MLSVFSDNDVEVLQKKKKKNKTKTCLGEEKS